jgi:hypothetical protein
MTSLGTLGACKASSLQNLRWFILTATIFRRYIAAQLVAGFSWLVLEFPMSFQQSVLY